MFKNYYSLFLLIAILTTAGCATIAGNSKTVEEDYGNSVRQMVQAQIFDPNAAAFPDDEGPMSYDGGKSVRTLESYRKDLPKADAVASDALDLGIED